MRAIGIAFATALTLGGCATITKGTSQTVAIDTPGVPGALCTVATTVGPQTVSTPGVVVLAKSSAALPVRCTKPGYQDGGGILGSTFETMTAGNLIVGGVIGFGVDAMSGAINKYPDAITIPMIPLPGYGVAPAVPVQPGRQRKGGPPVAAVRPAVAPPAPAPLPPQEPEPQLSEADRTMNSRN